MITDYKITNLLSGSLLDVKLVKVALVEILYNSQLFTTVVHGEKDK